MTVGQNVIILPHEYMKFLKLHNIRNIPIYEPQNYINHNFNEFTIKGQNRGVLNESCCIINNP